MKKLIIMLLTIVAVAFCAWAYQLQFGLGVTGMNKPVFWGMYIVTFVFFIGISAGGIAVASLSHLAGIEKFKPVSKVAEVVAIISLILAMIAIVFDLGRPDRMLHLFIYPQFNSPLIWDVFVINIYLVLCVAMLYFGIKGKTKLLKTVAVISIPAFVLVHSITAWIFGLMKSQAGWHTAILAPLFIVSALVSGLAAVILAMNFSRQFLGVTTCNDDTIISLGKYFKALLPILFYFLFCEFLTAGFANIPKHAMILKELFVGRFAGIFWFDIGLGIIIPFLIIISKFGKTISGVGIASLLSFLGVFAERIDIVLPSFFHPALMNIRIPYIYKPTGVEYLLIFGLFALGVIFFITATKIIPLCEGGER
jgi:molybdopterin-containing oxidoreductase family membrane subunit